MAGIAGNVGKFVCPICKGYRAKKYPHKAFRGLEGNAYECLTCGTIRAHGKLLKIGKQAYKLGFIAK